MYHDWITIFITDANGKLAVSVKNDNHWTERCVITGKHGPYFLVCEQRCGGLIGIGRKCRNMVDLLKQ